MRDLKELVAELDVVKSWFGHGSAQHSKVSEIADELAEHAGGRNELQSGDPGLATPGPGVKSQTATPVEVDSIGQVAEKPSQTAAEAAVKDPSRFGQSGGDAKTTV